MRLMLALLVVVGMKKNGGKSGNRTLCVPSARTLRNSVVYRCRMS